MTEKHQYLKIAEFVLLIIAGIIKKKQTNKQTKKTSKQTNSYIMSKHYSKKTFSRSFYSQPQVEQGRQFERYTFNRRRQRNHINCLIGREASMLLVEMYVRTGTILMVL